MARSSRARAVPASDVLARFMGRFSADVQPDPAGDASPVPSPAVPALTRPGRLPAKHPDVLFDRLPVYVRSHARLKDADKLCYSAVLSLCWRGRLATEATNSQIRRALGGTDRTLEFISKDGRKRTRTVKRSGRSDDSIRRSLARLVECLLIRIDDDPTSLSTRRITLLDIPSLPGLADDDCPTLPPD